jgi:ribonuclease D
MIKKNNSPNFYITSQPELQQVVELIKSAKLVAIDTEFTRRTTYYPILSIIQIAVKNSLGEKEFFIVDCLAELDLSGLFQVIADEKIVKILHSSTQDLQIFFHESGLQPQNVMDTQVMANFCGFAFSVGYSNLVENFFQKKLDKKQQISDWQRRPLNKKQLEYAILDVTFLEEIYEKFCEILSEKNRADWYLEEIKNFTKKTLEKNDENLSKNFSFKGKNSQQISQIKKLILWREQWARKVNVPRQHLLKDEELERIAINKNFNPNFDRSISQKIVDEILGEMKKILDENENFSGRNSFAEKRFFMNERQKNSYQEAKKLINEIAMKENFCEQFLITSSDLRTVICEKTFFAKKVAGWRYQLFGKELEQLILS